ncbi:hypothetical protein, partial [Corynebacterium parakroppenstedtii]|uniref:hypothetical protein n=1 Tax=Corynebacterium parakroppenstedtii TaxID=2828363 RepID=UPI0030EF24C2
MISAFYQSQGKPKQPGLGRGPALPCRGVVLRAAFKGTKSGKSGFPFREEHDEQEEHEHDEDECKDHNPLLQ